MTLLISVHFLIPRTCVLYFILIIISVSPPHSWYINSYDLTLDDFITNYYNDILKSTLAIINRPSYFVAKT